MCDWIFKRTYTKSSNLFSYSTLRLFRRWSEMRCCEYINKCKATNMRVLNVCSQIKRKVNYFEANKWPVWNDIVILTYFTDTLEALRSFRGKKVMSFPNVPIYLSILTFCYDFSHYHIAHRANKLCILLLILKLTEYTLTILAS